MAQIEKRANGTYRIRVFCGYSADGEHQKSQSMTWKPKPNMTEAQIQKAVSKAAFEFEQECKSGTTVNTMKLETLIQEWFENYAARTLKQSGIERCKGYCPRVIERLGHYRIDRITPLEIDRFIAWLMKERVKKDDNAQCKIDLKYIQYQKDLKQKDIAEKAGVSAQTVKAAIDGKVIKLENAKKLSAALDIPFDKMFNKIDNSKHLEPKTIKNYISFLSSVFNYAVKIRAISENPCKNASLPKIPQKEMVMFTVEQAQTFLEILEKDDTPITYKALFQLALFGGCRIGEALGLEWNDVDFEKNMIHIRRTYHYSSEIGYYYTEPKSKKSVRNLKLPDIAMFTLKQLQNYQLSQRLALGDKWNNSNLLFTTWNGKQLNGATSFAWLTDVCEKYNLPKVNQHSFRHLNASLQIANGVDVKTVQSTLGHSQASTTLDIYAAAFAEREAQALDTVANVLTSPKKEAK